MNAEDIYEVLVDACPDRTSVSKLCENNTDSPHENMVLSHLCEKFDFESVERVGTTLLRKDVFEILSKPMEVCNGLHLRPYYGDEDDTDGLYHSEAKCGPLRSRLRNTLRTCEEKRYTLAVHTASSVLAEFRGILNGLDAEVKAPSTLTADHDSKCLALLQARSPAYVMPIVCWGKTIKEELSEGWSRVTQHDLTAKLDGHRSGLHTF